METISTLRQAKKATPGLYNVKDAEGVNFNKRGKAFGAGGFTFRFWFGDERLLMSLGSPNDFADLEEVRDAATAARKLVKAGINPLIERDRKKAINLAAKQPVTFRQKAEAVRDVYTPTLKHKYAAGNWFNPIERHVFPLIGDLSISDVEPRHIAKVLAAIDVAAPKSVHRLRAHVAMVFNVALADGDRDPLRGNPADAGLMRAMRPGAFKANDEHYARIERADAPLAIKALREARKVADGSLMTAALDAWLFMIATALRPGEALKCTWGEIDLPKKLATISAARMKGRRGRTRPHAAPLSTLALEVLARRQAIRIGDDPGAPVFAGSNGSPPSHTYFALAPSKAGITPLVKGKPKTPPIGAAHSWRSIFRDWASESGIPHDLAELALAHALPAVVGAYLRDGAVGPRTPIMESYSRWLTGDADANVIALPVRAA